MKKFIAGLIVGTVLFMPSFAVAQKYTQLPFTNSIYNVVDPGRTTEISVFDDKDNKCYVALSGTRYTEEAGRVAISCVKSGGLE